MQHFDIKSIWLSIGVFYFLFSGMVFIYWYNYKNIIKGIGHLGTGILFVGTGILLRVLETHVSDIISVVLGNIIAFYGLFLMAKGVARLNGKKNFIFIDTLIISTLVLSAVYFGYLSPSLKMRISTTSLVVSMIYIRAFWHLIDLYRREKRKGYLIIAAPFIIAVPGALFRAVYSFMYYKGPDYFSVSSSEIIFIFTFYIGLLIWTMGLILITSYEIRLNTEQALKEKTEALKKNTLLIKEMNHRVKNNLTMLQSLLMLQSQRIHDDRSKDALRDTENRLMAISNIHHMLSHTIDLTEVKATSYIKSLISDISSNSSSNDRAVDVHTDIGDIQLDMDILIPLGLILNELITNAFKYAFQARTQGEIFISLNPATDGEYRLIVKDNGIGMPRHINIYETDSLGMNIITSLVEQINARLEYSAEHDRGTEFKVTFNDTLSN